MTRIPVRVEKAFLTLVLLLSTGAVAGVYLEQRGADPNSPDGDVVSQIIWLAVYLLMAPSLLMRASQIWAVIVRDKLLLSLLSLACISATWSALPTLTIRTAAALIATTVLSAYMAARYTPREQLAMLGVALALAAVLSLVCALLFPQIGIDADGHWRGVFTHKNSLGRLMALAAILFYILARGARRSTRVAWLGCGVVAVALLAFSQSSTAIIVFAGLLSGVGVVVWVRRRPRRRLAPALVFVAICALVAFLAGTLVVQPFLEVLGKDDTLTGRTLVWAYAWDAVQSRPLLGFGYTAFWPGAVGQGIQASLGPAFIHSHNGYLDLALQLGAVGLLTFAISLCWNIARSLTAPIHDFEDVWPSIFLIFLVMYNMTESSLLQRNDLFWILYVAVTLSMRRMRQGQGAAASQTLRPAALNALPPLAGAA